MNIERNATDITLKWELAERISGNAKAPQEVLNSIFKGIMEGFEEIANIKIEDSTKKRVWDQVSVERLKKLKEILILEFCEKILNGFKENEVSELLEEHKKTGIIRNSKYNGKIRSVYDSNQNLIVNSIIKKANLMTNDWIPEIVEVLKKEGIKLPITRSF